MKRFLPLVALGASVFLGGCQLLVLLVGADRCDQEGLAECNEDGVSVVCRDGFITKEICEVGCAEATGLCISASCGDGILDTGEECDDQNAVDGDGCNAQCFREVCGNLVVDANEVCDDGERCADGTACVEDAGCAGIGDGVCRPRSGDGCVENCSKEEVCGDAFIDIGEACDDGNTLAGDGCRVDCLGTERCGDGLFDPQSQTPEQCDDGNNLSGDDCNAGCQDEICGNGVVDLQEQCDDNNTISGDGCAADCTTENIGCGNGDPQNPTANLDPGEVCDDGNNQSGDGCRGDCLKLEICGDGAVDPQEACDDSNTQNGDGCRGDCLGTEQCGDNFVDAGEVCDDGNNASGDGCTADCSKAEVCGDGFVDVGEQCDDGNENDNDACKNDCTSSCGGGDAQVLDSNGHCYLHFNTTRTWQDAQADCVARGGHLATISNAAENTTVHSLNFGSSPWIGMNDQGTEDAFVWVTGERSVFHNFTRNEPSNSGNNEDCVNFIPNSNLWNDLNCTSQQPYVCEIETRLCGNGVTEAGETCDDGNLNNGDGCSSTCSFTCGEGITNLAGPPLSDPLTGACYVGSGEEFLSQVEARAICEGNGGHLITIHTQHENDFARPATNNSGTAWLGMNESTSQNDVFTWNTGESFGFDNFASGQPSSSSAGNCVVYFNNSGGNQLFWDDVSCTSAIRRYICEF